MLSCLAGGTDVAISAATLERVYHDVQILAWPKDSGRRLVAAPRDSGGTEVGVGCRQANAHLDRVWSRVQNMP